MNNMDWDSDPELKALRDEFIDSFPKRMESLKPLLHLLKASSTSKVDPSVAQEIGFIVHNLAGIAVSYGFKELGKIATALDDLISHQKDRILRDQLLKFATVLNSALNEAGRTRQDKAVSSAEQAIVTELISCVESLASSAKP
jgi:chemotaxis protein histidine kinase CheA